MTKNQVVKIKGIIGRVDRQTLKQGGREEQKGN